MKQLDEGEKNGEIAPYVNGNGYSAESSEIYAESYYGGAGEQHSSDRLLLQFVLGTIRKHWILIIAITLLGTAGSVLYVAQKPDYFTSRARVQVNAENNILPPGKNGASPIIIGSTQQDPAYFTTQLQVLEGSELLMRVVKGLDLENNPTFRNPNSGRTATVWQNVLRMIGQGEPRAIPEKEKGVEQKLSAMDSQSADLAPEDIDKLAPYVSAIKQGLVVLPVKDNRTSFRETRLIDISYTHQNSELAAKIANAIADTYVLQNLEQKVRTNASAGDFFQKRVAELQASIRVGEEKLVNYSRDNRIVSPDVSQNTVVQRFGDLNKQLGQAENDRIVAQTAYQAAYQNVMRNAIAEADNPQLVALEGQLTGLRQKLAQLKTEYTDEWWEVVQVRKQIDGLDSQVTQLRRRASDIQLAKLKERLDEASDREQRLRGLFSQQREDVLQQNEVSINYRIIQQEVDTNKALLSSLLQRSRENDVILQDTPNNVLVSERGATPIVPAGPERSKTILLVFLTSMFAGCGLAILLGWLDDSIHYSEDIEETLGLPVLAVIPAVAGNITNGSVFRKLLPLRSAKRTRHEKYDLAAFERPEIAETYIQLRTHLLLSKAGGPPKTILVSSAEEREGKTMTALNLAVGLAEPHKKVLLIDADLRCPRIDSIKEIPNKFGLTALLADGVLTDESIEQAIQIDPAGGPHILTAGEHSVNPATLLASEQMTWLLARLSRRYDYIVVDSPPALYFADSTIISSKVDSVVLVVRDGVSSSQTLLKIQRLFQTVGARILGVVINAVPNHKQVYNRYIDYYGEPRLVDEPTGPLRLG